MKLIPAAIAAMLLLAACDAKVTTVSPQQSPQPDKVVEKNTTVVNNPPAQETKVEKNTTIVNPRAGSPDDKRTTTTTTTTDNK